LLLQTLSALKSICGTVRRQHVLLKSEVVDSRAVDLQSLSPNHASSPISPAVRPPGGLWTCTSGKNHMHPL
jgi:hypothetical protein